MPAVWAFNWGLAQVKADLDARRANPAHESVDWDLGSLRKVWNRAKNDGGQHGSADPAYVHVERIPGDAAIVDPDDAGTGVGGELFPEPIPRRPRRLIGVNEHLNVLRCNMFCRTRTGKHSV